MKLSIYVFIDDLEKLDTWLENPAAAVPSVRLAWTPLPHFVAVIIDSLWMYEQLYEAWDNE